jgi:hypothetical protein
MDLGADKMTDLPYYDRPRTEEGIQARVDLIAQWKAEEAANKAAARMAPSLQRYQEPRGLLQRLGLGKK